ncbi:hydroxyacylglutathione hydrolase [Comamonadaceae bacterium OH2545_COT-014]|nr:hydroxyacylglutathione hydrolase [Comamonadaceae bacterium OH2545_COT-014]
MELIALPAFSDNYIWLLHDGVHALAVDPGDASPVSHALAARGLRLAAILVTHHHPDHTGGVAALQAATSAAVYGPAREVLPFAHTPVDGGDEVMALGRPWRVLDVPGHTAGHVAYWSERAHSGVGAPLLFCGDTLFSGGCGRLFEGTPSQMLASLDTLAALPPDTQVCAAHEYTLANLRFARAVEPANDVLAAHQRQCEALRAREMPTLPSTMGLECAINPFLRSRQAHVAQAVCAARGIDPTADSVAVFAALREWKNDFK